MLLFVFRRLLGVWRRAEKKNGERFGGVRVSEVAGQNNCWH